MEAGSQLSYQFENLTVAPLLRLPAELGTRLDPIPAFPSMPCSSAPPHFRPTQGNAFRLASDNIGAKRAPVCLGARRNRFASGTHTRTYVRRFMLHGANRVKRENIVRRDHLKHASKDNLLNDGQIALATVCVPELSPRFPYTDGHSTG